MRERFIRGVVWTLVLAGAALRTWQYAGGTSLYVDELAIANNLTSRSLISLLTAPLTGHQVAPPGFLLLQKVVVDVFGASDMALRLVPFLASLAALVLFARLALRVDESAAVLAMALFATAIPLIYYGAQAKQYSLDVCASVLLLSAAMDLWPADVTRRARVTAALSGALIVWFSQASVLVLCGLGIVLMARTIRLRTWKTIAPVMLVWALASIAATAWAFVDMAPEARAYLRVFWVGGFMPLPLRSAVGARWPMQPLIHFFAAPGTDTLRYPYPAFFVVVAVVGFLALWRIRRDACALALAPIVVTLAASAAQAYPFSDRLVMFLIPNVLLAIAAIPRWIASFDRPDSHALAWTSVLLIGVAGVSPVVRWPPVYRTEDIKPVLRELRARRAPGDPIYVYYGGAAAAVRYAEATGFRDSEFDLGDCHRADTRSYFRELDRYRGRSVWVVIQHATLTYGERDDILGYLNAIGTEREAIVVPSTLISFPNGAATAYLYDLRDPQRLRRASAGTFPLRGRQTLDAAFPCSGVPAPARSE